MTNREAIFLLQVYVPSMFWITVLDAFYQSLVCFFVPYFVSTHIHMSHYISSVHESVYHLLVVLQQLETKAT